MRTVAHCNLLQDNLTGGVTKCCTPSIAKVWYQLALACLPTVAVEVTVRCKNSWAFQSIFRYACRQLQRLSTANVVTCLLGRTCICLLVPKHCLHCCLPMGMLPGCGTLEQKIGDGASQPPYTRHLLQAVQQGVCNCLMCMKVADKGIHSNWQ